MGGGGAGAARDVLELMAHDRMLPGNNVVIWGNSSYTQRAADALEALGAAVTRLGNDASITQIVSQARIEGVLVERDAPSRSSPATHSSFRTTWPPRNSWRTAKLKPTCPPCRPADRVARIRESCSGRHGIGGVWQEFANSVPPEGAKRYSIPVFLPNSRSTG